MNNEIKNYIESVELGEEIKVENMVIYPVFAKPEREQAYITLGEALEERTLEIGEVTEVGSIPQLKVIYKGKLPLLLIDGEEMVGAKQNRIINTSILIKEESETIIPVSCTEQGRWGYRSRNFDDSGIVASQKMRMRKSASVSDSLMREGSYRSDQGEVWNEVHSLGLKLGIQSPTHAMKDMYNGKMDEIDKAIMELEPVQDQRGIMVFYNGKVSGIDIVSLSEAYKRYHKKLLKSYVVEAMYEREKKEAEVTKEQAMEFLRNAVKCDEKTFKSLGYGYDHRFTSKSIVGSALLYNGVVPHTAFFMIEEEDRIENMAGSNRRRGYRM